MMFVNGANYIEGDDVLGNNKNETKRKVKKMRRSSYKIEALTREKTYEAKKSDEKEGNEYKRTYNGINRIAFTFRAPSEKAFDRMAIAVRTYRSLWRVFRAEAKAEGKKPDLTEFWARVYRCRKVDAECSLLLLELRELFNCGRRELFEESFLDPTFAWRVTFEKIVEATPESAPAPAEGGAK